MAEYHADEFIRLAFPGADFQIISTKLEKELIVKTKVVDTVVKIAEGGKEHLIHFEFQTEYHSDIAKRIFTYAGALTTKYDLSVTSILFQIKPPPKKVETFNRYDVNLFGMVTNYFGFHCVKLWELYDEIISGKKEYIGFVALLLELSSKPDKELLDRQRQLIQQEQDLNRRTELTGLCLALASKHFDFKYLNQFFKEDIDMLEGLEQVPYIGEKIKNARKEGMEKGIQKGLYDGIRGNIIETLKIRFQSVDGLEDLINTINEVDTLRKVFHLALTSDSLDGFKNNIAGILN